MSTLHVIYRVDDENTLDEQWATYSFPAAIYTEGHSLAAARREFREAARDLLGDEFDTTIVIEHLERPLYRGAYLRVAVDRHKLDREDVAEAFRSSLTHGSLALADQREHFEATVPLAASGDRIVVACVAQDRVRWVLEQMAPQDSVAVCVPGPVAAGHRLVPWSFLAREEAELGPGILDNVERISDAGLGVDSTVGELVHSSTSGAHAPGRGVLITA